MTPGSFDTVVVGAGSAGCVLAARLSTDPSRRVLVLEAGPDLRPATLPEELRFLSRPVRWPYEWGDRVVNADGRLLTYARGRGVGGSSGTNGAVAIRPEPPDLDTWPAGWRWDDLLPRLNAIEHDLDFGDRPWHGDAGPVPITRWPESSWNEMQAGFVAGCEALGFVRCPDHNEPHTTGVGPIPMNRVGVERRSAMVTHLDPARDRPNLEVRGDTAVRRVVFVGGRARGVELADGSVVRCDDVVLAAGVVQDPLLLWRSGIGPADRLRALGVDVVADLPAVGLHLGDHPVVTASFPMLPGAVPDDAPSLQTILRVSAPGSDRGNDLQITPVARRHEDGRRDLLLSISLQLPDGEGSVEPGPTPDDPAVIRWPFTALATNIARLREGWRLATAIARASGLLLDPGDAERELARSDEDLDRMVAASHTAFYHGVGTCRMGDGAEDHVVDTACRVLGTEGLRVVDASIIPTVPRSNTNLAVMAVAEHALSSARLR